MGDLVLSIRKSPFHWAARVAVTVGLFAFVLPFATVSCGGQHVLSATGLNAITGGHYGVLGQAQTQTYSGNLAILLALLGGVVALLIVLLPVRVRVRALVGGLAGLWSAAMLLLGQAQVRAELADANSHGAVTVRLEAGFWLALAAFSCSALMAALDLYRARSEPIGRPALSFDPLNQALPRSNLVIAGGVVALVGSLMIVAACVLPFVHYTDQTTQPSSPSVLNPGFDPSNWFAAEPIGVAILALLAAAGLAVWWRSVIRAIAASVLLAYGVQTCLLFAGYVELAVKSPAAQLAPGGVIGMMAGVLLFAGGLAGMLTLFRREPGAPQAIPTQ